MLLMSIRYFSRCLRRRLTRLIHYATATRTGISFSLLCLRRSVSLSGIQYFLCHKYETSIRIDQIPIFTATEEFSSVNYL